MNKQYPTLGYSLKRIPDIFINDGLSGGFPDWIYSRWNLTLADRPHAWGYCTRCHPAGSMTHDKQEYFDGMLKAHANELLPWYLPLAPIILFLGVSLGGHESFDTCGIHPEGASDTQIANNLCRHNMSKPEWMKKLEERNATT